jgi:hypothetical protein
VVQFWIELSSEKCPLYIHYLGPKSGHQNDCQDDFDGYIIHDRRRLVSRIEMFSVLLLKTTRCDCIVRRPFFHYPSCRQDFGRLRYTVSCNRLENAVIGQAFVLLINGLIVMAEFWAEVVDGKGAFLTAEFDPKSAHHNDCQEEFDGCIIHDRRRLVRRIEMFSVLLLKTTRCDCIVRRPFFHYPSCRQDFGRSRYTVSCNRLENVVIGQVYVLLCWRAQKAQ